MSNSNTLKIKKRAPREYILFVSIIFIGIVLDQLSKWLAVRFLMPTPDGSVSVIPGLINFTYKENLGAAFGSFEDNRWVFLISSSVMIIALGLYLFLGFCNSRLGQISVSMVISGGIGNMIDRVGCGFAPTKYAVVDFLEFDFVEFAIFNVADSIVCIGAALMFISMFSDIIAEEREKKLQAKVSASEDGSADSDGKPLGD